MPAVRFVARTVASVEAWALAGAAISASLAVWVTAATVFSDDPILVLFWSPFLAAAAAPMVAWIFGRAWTEVAKPCAALLLFCGALALVLLGPALLVPGVLLLPAAYLGRDIGDDRRR